MTEQIALFPDLEPERLQPAKTLRDSERGARAAWTKYTGRRVACDECVVFLHENGGAGPYPRSARKVRAVAARSEKLLLCDEHAEPRKAADDALAAAKKAPKRRARR